uniref:Junctional adhesion molecule A n=1 Tax=Acanthochromis polyacanthus TaxID=80966 RepID=A0A3Q1FSL5_9TELE
MFTSSSFVSVLLFLYAATGVSGFSVTVQSDNDVKENEATDLKCQYSADFGSNPRIEWKFKDTKDSQAYVVYNGKLTTPYADRVQLYDGSNLRFSKVTRKDNGEYSCEVSNGSNQLGEGKVMLIVQVPPSPPVCRIPTAVTTGKTAVLSCYDADGSPPPTYQWFKDGTLLPTDPTSLAAFKNYTYKMNTVTGKLEFPRATKMDSGQYFCEAVNSAGPAQRCKAVRMEVRDLNTGGIVAGVIVALLLVALLVFGIWYANKKGYLPSEFSTLCLNDSIRPPVLISILILICE